MGMCQDEGFCLRPENPKPYIAAGSGSNAHDIEFCSSGDRFSLVIRNTLAARR